MTGLRTGYLFAWEHFLGEKPTVRPDLLIFGKAFRFAGVVSVNPTEESLVPPTLLEHWNGHVTEAVSSQVLLTSQFLLAFVHRDQILQKWRDADESNRATITEIFRAMSGRVTRTTQELTVRGMGAIWVVSRPTHTISRLLLDIFAQPTLEELRRNLPHGDFQ